jgi:hypothetical protein
MTDQDEFHEREDDPIIHVSLTPRHAAMICLSLQGTGERIMTAHQGAHTLEVAATIMHMNSAMKTIQAAAMSAISGGFAANVEDELAALLADREDS